MAANERLDRTKTGLVIFDMQKGQFEVDDPERRRWLAEANVLANTVKLLAAARSAGIPVFYIQNNRRPDFADQKEVLTDAGGGVRFTIERIFPMLARVRTGAQVASMLDLGGSHGL